MGSRSSGPLLYDEQVRRELHDRLSRIEGQLRGVGRMIDTQRPTQEVLQQLASARSAVKGLTKAVLRNYLERSAKDALKSGDPAVFDELIETLTKFVKE
jgi:DNA-binding FrmR family transcriptional regulator